MIEIIGEAARKIYQVVNKLRRLQIEDQKLEAQKGINEKIEREKKKPAVEEFLELHYPYLLNFVQNESESVDFVNIRVAMGARHPFNLAASGGISCLKLDKFDRDETFPPTTLEMLKKILRWEGLSEDLAVDKGIEEYLIARRDYNRNRKNLKNQLTRAIKKRPGFLLYNIKFNLSKSDRKKLIKSLKKDPDEFVEDVLKNKGIGPGANLPGASVYMKYHDDLIEHIRSHWQYNDDFEELEQDVERIQSNFDELYNYRIETDRMVEEYSGEKREYGLLIRLHDELLDRYKLSENMLRPIDPEKVPAPDAADTYKQRKD